MSSASDTRPTARGFRVPVERDSTKRPTMASLPRGTLLGGNRPYILASKREISVWRLDRTRKQTEMSRSEIRVSETTTGDPRIGSPVCKEITSGDLVFEATRYIS